MNHVAGIDLPQANAPIERRSDVAVSDLQFRIVDQRLVIVDGSFDLMHQRALRVNLLLRNAARGNQSCVAFQIQLGIAELSLVAG